MKYKRKTTLATGVLAAAALALPAAAQPTLPTPGVPDPPYLTDTGPLDLTTRGPQAGEMPGDVGGTAIIADHWEQPTGTGVFDPFLTLDANGQTSTGGNHIEQAYNIPGFLGDGGPPNPIFPDLDQLKPNWNTTLRYGDLADIDGYHAFILDANEQGSRQDRLISIDNIRVYTSPTDTFGRTGDTDDLGLLRWAMNDPLSEGTSPPDIDGFNVEKWVLLDASQEDVSHGNANGGSGQGDMVVFIPVEDFAGASPTDYVWFYNLNGVHHQAEYDADGADAGFEEWRAVLGPQRVPDGGSTLILLGLGMAGFAAMRRKQS